MSKIKKRLIIIIAVLILMTSIASRVLGFSLKASVENNDENSYVITLYIEKFLDESPQGINAFICDISYDRNIFNEIESEDIEMLNGWGDVTFNKKNGALVSLRTDFTKNENEPILKVKLKQKENIKKNTTKIYLKNIQSSDGQRDLNAEDIEIKLGNKNFLNNIMIWIIIISGLVILIIINKKRKQTRRKK